MIRLTQFAASPLCSQIRRALNFKGVEFEAFEWPIGELGALGLQAQSASGGLPIIQFDGGESFRNTAIIALEIESRFQRPPLLPESPIERAQVLMLENWAAEALYFYGLAVRFLPEEEEASIRRILVNAGDVYDIARDIVAERLQGILTAHGLAGLTREQLIAHLQRLLGGVEVMQQRTGFVVGSAITLADIAIVSQIVEAGETGAGGEVLASRPTLREYVERIDAVAPA